MGTKLSYDYSELLNELQSDIGEGLIKPSSSIYVTRSKEPIGHGSNYHPIVDYYYSDTASKSLKSDTEQGIVTTKKVNEVIDEMKEWNDVFHEEWNKA
jgi:hypothetical protein